MTTTRARQIVLAARPKGKPELYGLENAPGTFIGMLEELNLGKPIVREAA